MRIIDKNHDFYDYLADPNDVIVFDRRGSFLLEKQHVLDAIYYLNVHYCRYNSDREHKFLVLQCGAAFWVFLLTVTLWNQPYWTGSAVPADYDLSLVTSWKDYGAKSRPLCVRVTACNAVKYDRRTKRWIFDLDTLDTDQIKQSANTSHCKDLSTLQVSKSTRQGIERHDYTIPILSGVGINKLVDPLDIFCSIEEHFSRERTASERAEPIGATNEDKIIMHGFDTKTSFRGKCS